MKIASSLATILCLASWLEVFGQDLGQVPQHNDFTFDQLMQTEKFANLIQDEKKTLPETEVRPPVEPTPDSTKRESEPTAPASSDLPLIAPNSESLTQPSFSDGESIPSPVLSPLVRAAPSDDANPIDAPASKNRSNGPSVFGGSFPSLRDQSFGGFASDPTGLNSVLRGEGNLFETPQLGTIVDRNRLEQRQATTMFRALQDEVGITLQQTGNGQVSPFIRGLTGQQILILVDGIRMNTSILRSGPNQYASTIDPGSIERIEIIRGAESAMWGSDAIGGVINVITRSADPLRGNYSSPYCNQLYSTAEASSYTRIGYSGWAGATGITGGVSYLDTGNLDRGGDLGRQPATDYQQYAGDLKLQRMLNENHLFTFALQHFEQQDLKRSDRFLPFVQGPASDGSIPVQRPTVFDPQQRNLIYGRFEGLAPEGIGIADVYSLTFSGARTKEGSIIDRYSSNAVNALPTRREIGEFDDLGWGTVMSAAKSLDAWGRVSYGADYYAESIDSERVRINNPTQPGAFPVTIDPQYPDDSQADRVGTYLSWYVPLTNRLEATTSVRYENINLSGTPNFDALGPLYYARSYQDWIASVGLSYALTERIRLVGGVYEGFRAPTIDDLTANKISLQNNQSVPLLGNLAAEPEHSYTYEVGLKFSGDRLRLQAIEYWTDFESFLARESIGGVDFLTNQQAYLNGTELDGEYLLNQRLSVFGNFAYAYGTLTSSGEPISRIPPPTGLLGIRYQEPLHNSYFTLFTRMVDRADRYNSLNLSDVRFISGGTPGYATLNARIGRTFGRNDRHQVSLSLENITNKYYRVLGSGVDGAGFNAIFGYQLTL